MTDAITTIAAGLSFLARMPTLDSAPHDDEPSRLDRGAARPVRPADQTSLTSSASDSRPDDVSLARTALGTPVREALHDIGFDLEDAVSSGGFGVVYRARDRRLGRTVAIKVIDRPLRRRAGAAYALPREIETLATFQHPHIVPLFEAGTLADGGLPYLVMPWIEGTSLRRRLRSHGPLPVDEVLRMGIDLADALAALHNQGLVHRDIKPENVMTNGAHATVIDFGLVCAARAADTPPISGEFIVGTPVYMSPEQWELGGTIDGRADVYSLGCLLFELLTGHAPGQRQLGDALHVPTPEARRWTDTLATGDSRTDPERRQFRRTPRVRDHRRDIPPALDRLLHRAMTQNPSRRLPSAALLRDGLQQVQARLLNADEGRRTRRFVGFAAAAAVIAVIAAVPTMVAIRLDDIQQQRLASLIPERVLLTAVQNMSGDAALDPVADQVSRQVQSALARRVASADSLVLRNVDVIEPPDLALVAAPVPDAVDAIRPLALARGAGTVIAVSIERADDGVALRGVILDARAGTARGTVATTVVPVPATSSDIARVADSVAESIASALRSAPQRAPIARRATGID